MLNIIQRPSEPGGLIYFGDYRRLHAWCGDYLLWQKWSRGQFSLDWVTKLNWFLLADASRAQLWHRRSLVDKLLWGMRNEAYFQEQSKELWVGTRWSLLNMLIARGIHILKTRFLRNFFKKFIMYRPRCSTKRRLSSMLMSSEKPYR